jgi:hypothetical protein
MFRAQRAQRALPSITRALMVFAAASSCGGRPVLTAGPSRAGDGSTHEGADGGGGPPRGAGGATGACASAVECPAPASPCESAACDAGRCVVVAAVAGALVAVDDPADCFDTVCDGAGGVVKVLDLRNVPAAAGPCVVNECGPGGRVSSQPVVAGAPCGKGLCDGVGACVGCLANTDCDGAQICGEAHACAPTSCADGVQNGAESDVDCGGGACARCSDGKHCDYDADCASSLCHMSDHLCGAPTCTDKRKDGDETDVDCGGSCPPCAASAECRVDADCASRACFSAVTHRCLLDHCLDGHKDFDETDRDCGGVDCPKCTDFGACKQASDCQSGHCDQRGWCLTDTCFDGVHDGNETGVDCGGGLCAACALGQGCGIDYDCASNACDFVARTCIADACADHRRDNGETDIDCGGPTCGATCRLGQWCESNGDCAAGLTCSYGRQCQ